MENDINSVVVYLDNKQEVTSDEIERELLNKFNKIIRWSVIDVDNNQLKIDVTYEIKEV